MPARAFLLGCVILLRKKITWNSSGVYTQVYFHTETSDRSWYSVHPFALHARKAQTVIVDRETSLRV